MGRNGLAHLAGSCQHSRPLREGVGRNARCLRINRYQSVALYARAWVEIVKFCCPIDFALCHPPCEGVGRNIFAIMSTMGRRRHPPCEGVGRNAPNCPYLAQRWVALHVRAWVEMMNLALRTWLLSCRPPCEGVGRNFWLAAVVLAATCRPPCEGVGRNRSAGKSSEQVAGRPPCEGVGRNVVDHPVCQLDELVALHVRAWIEIQ